VRALLCTATNTSPHERFCFVSETINTGSFFTNVDGHSRYSVFEAICLQWTPSIVRMSWSYLMQITIRPWFVLLIEGRQSFLTWTFTRGNFAYKITDLDACSNWTVSSKCLESPTAEANSESHQTGTVNMWLPIGGFQVFQAWIQSSLCDLHRFWLWHWLHTKTVPSQVASRHLLHSRPVRFILISRAGL